MLDPRRATPAERLENGRDFLPTNKWVVFGHHFAAISAAGPLNGKTLISCVNPFGPRGLEVGLTTSAAEEFSRFARDAACG